MFFYIYHSNIIFYIYIKLITTVVLYIYLVIPCFWTFILVILSFLDIYYGNVFFTFINFFLVIYLSNTVIYFYHDSAMFFYIYHSNIIFHIFTLLQLCFFTFTIVILCFLDIHFSTPFLDIYHSNISNICCCCCLWTFITFLNNTMCIVHLTWLISFLDIYLLFIWISTMAIPLFGLVFFFTFTMVIPCVLDIYLSNAMFTGHLSW